MTFETMMGDVIDPFRNTAPAVNQEFLRKNQIDKSACHIKKIDKSIISYEGTHFASIGNKYLLKIGHF